MRLLDHEKTLDEQIRDIKQGKDSKNLMRQLPKMEGYTYTKEQKDKRSSKETLNFNSQELFRKLGGIKGLDEFIRQASILKGKSNKEKQILGSRYKVSLVIVNRAIDGPDFMRESFIKTKELLKLKRKRR